MCSEYAPAAATLSGWAQRRPHPRFSSHRPVLMQGIAKTGSGKTAAFVLPMLVHIMDQPELQAGAFCWVSAQTPLHVPLHHVGLSPTWRCCSDCWCTLRRQRGLQAGGCCLEQLPGAHACNPWAQQQPPANASPRTCHALPSAEGRGADRRDCGAHARAGGADTQGST